MTGHPTRDKTLTRLNIVFYLDDLVRCINGRKIDIEVSALDQRCVKVLTFYRKITRLSEGYFWFLKIKNNATKKIAHKFPRKRNPHWNLSLFSKDIH